MTDVYLALGSNVGDSQSNIATAVELLGSSIQKITLAPIYRSRAVGVTDQPDFFNTVLRGQTKLTSKELLDLIKKIEQRIGRQERYRWGPREIDIDIIFYGNEIIKSNDLTVPHPLFHKRDFVLRPLLDLNPELIDPVTKQSVKELLNQLDPGQLSIK